MERSTAGIPGGAERPSAAGGASRIEQIIEEAQQSARQFIDNAKRQAGMIVEEAQQEARTRRADVVGNARQRVDDLVQAAEGMLRDVGRLNSELTDLVKGLRESSQRLQVHIADLLKEEQAPAGGAQRRRLGGRH